MLKEGSIYRICNSDVRLCLLLVFTAIGLLVWIGREKELREKEKAQHLYLHVKSEVESYLKEKREKDPYRSTLTGLLYQAGNGSDAEIPTFEPAS